MAAQGEPQPEPVRGDGEPVGFGPLPPEGQIEGGYLSLVDPGRPGRAVGADVYFEGVVEAEDARVAEKQQVVRAGAGAKA